MVDQVKTWLEYINEEAMKFGLEVWPRDMGSGSYFSIERNGHQAGVAETREAVETFIAGCAWTRDGL